MLGIGATAVIFGFARYFARGPAPTMTREYQEASDAYLKVRNSPCLYASVPPRASQLTSSRNAGTKRRAHYWYLCSGFQGWLHGPEQACSQVNLLGSSQGQRTTDLAAALSRCSRFVSGIGPPCRSERKPSTVPVLSSPVQRSSISSSLFKSPVFSSPLAFHKIDACEA